MRGLTPEIENPHPLVTMLPAAFQGQEFTEQFLSALDDALAPLLMTLDNVDAYLDPAITPPDFLPWLASWVGIELDENWSQDQQRRLVGEAVGLLQWRGTRRGTVDVIRHFLGIPSEQIEIEESGGVAWSATPDGAIPGAMPPRVLVRVRTDDPGAVDTDRLDRLVAATVPAHVDHEVEVSPA